MARSCFIRIRRHPNRCGKPPCLFKRESVRLVWLGLLEQLHDGLCQCAEVEIAAHESDKPLRPASQIRMLLKGQSRQICSQFECPLFHDLGAELQISNKLIEKPRAIGYKRSRTGAIANPPARVACDLWLPLLDFAKLLPKSLSKIATALCETEAVPETFVNSVKLIRPSTSLGVIHVRTKASNPTDGESWKVKHDNRKDGDQADAGYGPRIICSKGDLMHEKSQKRK